MICLHSQINSSHSHIQPDIEDWLKSNIASICRKSYTNVAESYRPISFICICCSIQQERLYKCGRKLPANITHMYMLQHTTRKAIQTWQKVTGQYHLYVYAASHGTHNIQTHFRTLSEKHFTYHTPACIQNRMSRYNTINSNTTKLNAI